MLLLGPELAVLGDQCWASPEGGKEEETLTFRESKSPVSRVGSLDPALESRGVQRDRQVPRPLPGPGALCSVLPQGPAFETSSWGLRLSDICRPRSMVASVA